MAKRHPDLKRCSIPTIRGFEPCLGNFPLAWLKSLLLTAFRKREAPGVGKMKGNRV